MRKVMNCNRGWKFSKQDAKNLAVMPEGWDEVNLPHTWNALDGQDGGNDYYRGTCWYMKELDRTALPEGERYYLEFRGANSSSDVFVGGKHMGHHDGGYSTWRVDITEALSESGVIAVAVDNAPNETVYPQVADFTFYGGIYRDVNLIVVPQSHFDLEFYGSPGLAVTPEVCGNDARVELKVYPVQKKEGQFLIYKIYDRERSTVAEYKAEVSENRTTLVISDVNLWQGRKNPYLYTAEVLLCQDAQILDQVSARFGCRSYVIDPDRGFLLNGESYPLRGVSRHQDRLGIGNALLAEHHLEDMDLICEIGANTIRLAHYQHDQYFYDLCDERGMVVWAEIPYISRHMPDADEKTALQMRELVLQNYNHPSIVVWGLSNEITIRGTDEDLLENHRRLNELAHELDPTRLTTIACVTTCDIHDPYVQIPDVVSYNHYFGWYGGETSMNGPWFDMFHSTFPKIPIGVSEYGCEGLNWHTSNPVQGDYTEEYQAYYHEELIKQLYTRPYLWATHVWNMFDFGADGRNEGGENGQNHKGLVTFDRKYKKDSFYAYKSWLSQDPFVHICGKRYVERVEEITRVTVYSNQPEVELFVNGKSLGIQKSPEHFFYYDVPNAGESRLRAVAGDQWDESVIRKVEVFNESYRFQEKNTVLNWFDITEPEGYFSLKDKLKDIMAVKEGKKLIEGLMAEMSKGGNNKLSGMKMNGPMRMMIGGFTILRLTGMISTLGITVTKEQLLALNEQLNKIPKKGKKK